MNETPVFERHGRGEERLYFLRCFMRARLLLLAFDFGHRTLGRCDSFPSLIETVSEMAHLTALDRVYASLFCFRCLWSIYLKAISLPAISLKWK